MKNQSYQLLSLDALIDAATEITMSGVFPSNTVCAKLEVALRYLADSIDVSPGKAFADARSRGHTTANQLQDARENLSS